MEDKTFELVTKMYLEFTEFRNEMTEFKDDMTEFKADMNGFRADTTEFQVDMTGFKQEMKNDIIRLENKVDIVSKILYDGYQQTFEKLTTLENKVEDLTAKVEKQDVEITVIKGGKKTIAK